MDGLALPRLDGGDVNLGFESVVHVVRVCREDDVGDDLDEFLVAVARRPSLLEGRVRGTAPVLRDISRKHESGGPLGVFGLESLRPLALFTAQPCLLRDRGVDGESVFAAVEIRDRDRYGFLRLPIEGAALERA